VSGYISSNNQENILITIGCLNIYNIQLNKRRINMRKITFVIFLAIMFGIVLGGCSKIATLDIDKDESGNEYQIFEANVIDSGERLLVYPDEESTEFKSADKISVGLSKVKEMPEAVKPGDRIKIFYDGIIAESYPAQITADKIESIGHNHIIDGFFLMIDDIYKEDPGLNSNITMIAFDFGNTELLSKAEIETLLAMAKKEYGLEIIQGTFDELAEQGLIDKKNLYFETGVLIGLKDIEIDRDKNKITCSIEKWRSGLGAVGWEVNAEMDNGKWNIERENYWIS